MAKERAWWRRSDEQMVIAGCAHGTPDGEQIANTFVDNKVARGALRALQQSLCSRALKRYDIPNFSRLTSTSFSFSCSVSFSSFISFLLSAIVVLPALP